MKKEKIKDVLLMIEQKLLTWKARRELACVSINALESFETTHNKLLAAMLKEAKKEYNLGRDMVEQLTFEYECLKGHMEGSNG